MNGDNLHKLNLSIRLAWSRGTLKAIAVAVVVATGALWKFWDHIAGLLATAPLAAFIAALALFSATYANPAGDSFALDASRHSVTTDYEGFRR